MTPPTTDLDRLMPHRRPMRLIDSLLQVEGDTATTAATVTESWPLMSQGAVHPIVLVELAAQTAAALNGYTQQQTRDGRPDRMGFLVAVQTADLYASQIPVHSRIITRATTRPLLENYRLIRASASIADRLIGAVTLQTMLV